MIGVHDVGGYHNLGAINTVDDTVFHEEWEGQTIALLFVTGVIGSWALDEFRHEIEQMRPSEYLETPYYIHWLHSIEKLLVRDGFLTDEEIRQRQQDIRDGKPLPEVTTELDPSVVEKLREGARGIAYVGLGARRPDAEQHFAVGDRIRTKVRAVEGHTRLPWYVWNKPGVITAYSGTYPLPDSIAHRRGENPEPTWAVRFEGTDIWGASAEPNTSVTIDMFESYIDHDTVAETA